MENTIGARIKQLREARQLSVADFAKIADVGPTAIYGIEKDANNPSYDVLQRLLAYFDKLNPDWLLLGKGQMLRGEVEPAYRAQLRETAAQAQATKERLQVIVAESEQARAPMIVSREVEEMTPEGQIAYYKLRAEIAEQTLADYKEAQLHEKVVRLVGAAGGRSGFNDASADAADDDYTPPVMKAVTNHEYAEKAAEAERTLIGFGRGR